MRNDTFAPIASHHLVTATGGAPVGRLQLESTIKSINDSLTSIKNQPQQSPLQQALPLILAARVMRGF